MVKLYKIVVYVLILIGVLHSSLTPLFYKTLNADALWFFGTGLTYIFMGLYNLASIKVRILSISIISIILNFIGTVFTIAITYILKEPQAYLAMIMVITIFLLSIKLVIEATKK